MAASKHAASEHTASQPQYVGSASPQVAHASDAGAPARGSDEAARLIDEGSRLRFRAPELALACGERAAALAELDGAERTWIRGEALAVFARVRLGQRATTVARALTALRAAEACGHAEVTVPLRGDLAQCAASVGLPLIGVELLRPVLAARDTPPAERVPALLRLVGCAAAVARSETLDHALAEAGSLATGAGAGLDDDDPVLLRAATFRVTAALRRRQGDTSAAIEAARGGLQCFAEPAGRLADGCALEPRLAVELACGLLDSGSTAEALSLAEPFLHAPCRAAAVAPLSWLRLALASRVHLPSGAVARAEALVRDGLYYCRRHELPSLQGQLLCELARLEQALERPSEAVECLRAARMVEHGHARVLRRAAALLTGEFGRGQQYEMDIESLLSAPADRADSVEHEPRSSSARDVLARMGVSVGGGGRRRAADPAEQAPAEQAPSEQDPSEQDPAGGPGPEAAAGVEPAHRSPYAGDAPGGGSSAGEQPNLEAPGGRWTDLDGGPGLDDRDFDNRDPGGRWPEVDGPAFDDRDFDNRDFDGMNSVLEVFTSWAQTSPAPRSDRPRRQRREPEASAAAGGETVEELNGAASTPSRHSRGWPRAAPSPGDEHPGSPPDESSP